MHCIASMVRPQPLCVSVHWFYLHISIYNRKAIVIVHWSISTATTILIDQKHITHVSINSVLGMNAKWLIWIFKMCYKCGVDMGIAQYWKVGVSTMRVVFVLSFHCFPCSIFSHMFVVWPLTCFACSHHIEYTRECLDDSLSGIYGLQHPFICLFLSVLFALSFLLVFTFFLVQ